MNCSFLYRECIWLCLVDYYHTLIVNKMFNKTSYIARFKCSEKYLINSLKLSITLVLSRDYSVMLCTFTLVLNFFSSQSKFTYLVFLGVDDFYYCNKCKKGYKRSRSLWRHEKYECGKEPQFICRVSGCTYRAKQKTQLKGHLLGYHKMNVNNLREYLK